MHWCYLHDRPLEGLLGLQLKRAVGFAIFPKPHAKLSHVVQRSLSQISKLTNRKVFPSLLLLSNMSVRYFISEEVKYWSVDTQWVSRMPAIVGHCLDVFLCVHSIILVKDQFLSKSSTVHLSPVLLNYVIECPLFFFTIPLIVAVGYKIPMIQDVKLVNILLRNWDMSLSEF